MALNHKRNRHMLESNILTVPQAAQEKGCTRQAIYNALNRGHLTPVAMGTFTAIAKDEKYSDYAVKHTGGRAHKSYRAKRTTQE